MMRRLYDPTEYERFAAMQDTNVLITWGAFGLLVAGLVFAGNFVWHLFAGEPAEANPWNANTLEWQTPSPPKHGNWEEIPEVYHPPYEYSHPHVEKDWLAQNERSDVVTPAAEGGEPGEAGAVAGAGGAA
jgi:cytochrome c oxidase subunit 1